MANEPYQRHPFQFRLRTLMIGVTLVCLIAGYLAHEVGIVRERRDWLRTHDLLEKVGSYGSGAYLTLVPGKPEESPSLIRRLLGDEAQNSIEVSKYISRSDLRTVILLFPEARIEADAR
jgi:hypothetical protein